MELDLNKISVKDLKSLVRINKVPCKILKVSISKIKKDSVINLLKTFYATKRIQKFLRSKWAQKPICPVSLEPVQYPLFAFKPKGSKYFIYYNLEIYSNYLINTGDFRDPKTREVYNDETLKSIDKELLKNSIKVPLKGIYCASKNKKHYKQKKEIEDNILVLDRCLDEIISSLRSWIETKRTNIKIDILFMAFRSYFRRLCSFSRGDASGLIKRTIVSINNCVKDENDKITSTNRDSVILFLYQTQFDELGI